MRGQCHLAPVLLACFFGCASSDGFQESLSSVKLASDGTLVARWQIREESLGFAPSSEPSEVSYVVLAASRTDRKDLLNGFHTYTGGWNIRDRHYWASVAFTAIHLFVVAGIWFLLFGIYLVITLVRHIYWKRRLTGHRPQSRRVSIFLIVCAIVLISGSYVLYKNQGKFHENTGAVLESIIVQAKATGEKLRGISQYLTTAKQTKVFNISIPAVVQSGIDLIEIRMESSASSLSDSATQSADDIKKFLDSINSGLIVAIFIMFGVTAAGFVTSKMCDQRFVFIVVAAGWLVVTGTAVFTGVLLILHNVSGDTCLAVGEWLRSPAADTALAEVLPCVDGSTAAEAVKQSKEATLQLIEVVNEVITNVSNVNFAAQFAPYYFNQSGPPVPVLCNPFHWDLTDRLCSGDEVDMNNATQVWSSYVCQVSGAGICVTTGRLTPDFYAEMSTVVNLTGALYLLAPFLTDLERCAFVSETFGGIYRDRCPAMESQSKLMYVGMLIGAVAVKFSGAAWFVYGGRKSDEDSPERERPARPGGK